MKQRGPEGNETDGRMGRCRSLLFAFAWLMGNSKPYVLNNLARLVSLLEAPTGVA